VLLIRDMYGAAGIGAIRLTVCIVCLNCIFEVD
jgi:hypothetical protein